MTNFTSTRLITGDIHRLVDFYAQVTGIAPHWLAPVFAEFATKRATLAIAATETMALFGLNPGAPAAGAPAADSGTILDLRVADVDREAARLAVAGIAFVQEPTTMPWGNRSLLLRDPEGRLVNLFAPVTPEAIARLGEG
jgi:predicted enzyme related to lactoylglutathione lyase